MRRGMAEVDRGGRLQRACASFLTKAGLARHLLPERATNERIFDVSRSGWSRVPIDEHQTSSHLQGRAALSWVVGHFDAAESFALAERALSLEPLSSGLNGLRSRAGFRGR